MRIVPEITSKEKCKLDVKAGEPGRRSRRLGEACPWGGGEKPAGECIHHQKTAKNIEPAYHCGFDANKAVAALASRGLEKKYP